jgi:hypothetical protein
MHLDLDVLRLNVLPLPRRELLELEKTLFLRVPSDRFRVDDEGGGIVFDALRIGKDAGWRGLRRRRGKGKQRRGEGAKWRAWEEMFRVQGGRGTKERRTFGSWVVNSGYLTVMSSEFLEKTLTFPLSRK